MNDDLARFKDLYFETAKEQIKVLKENLEQFNTSENKEVTDKIFIAAHSLKGQSLMMGYVKVGEAARLIEKSFRNIKEGITQKNEINMNTVESIVNKINIWLDTPDTANMEPNFEQELTEFKKKLI